MIREAIDRVRELTLESNKPFYIQRPGDPAHVVQLVQMDGSVEQQETRPADRRLEVAQLSDLVRLAAERMTDWQRWSETEAPTIGASRQPALFVSVNSVRLVFDRMTGREYAFTRLHQAPEWTFFAARQEEPVIGVKDFREALRYELRGTFTSEKLLKQVSNLTARREQHATGSYDRGKESMGNIIQMEAGAPAEFGLPDERQWWNIHRWSNPDARFKLPLDTLLDPETLQQAWRVTVDDQSFHELDFKSLVMLQQKLVAMLAEAKADVPVFIGVWLGANAGQ